jgi:hypothetical protein
VVIEIIGVLIALVLLAVQAAGDGSVHFAKNSIDGSTWAAAGTRAGGEVYSFPF